jgi:hypothetical protein
VLFMDAKAIEIIERMELAIARLQTQVTKLQQDHTVLFNIVDARLARLDYEIVALRDRAHEHKEGV